MSFRFRTNETAAGGFHRVATSQITRARRHLAEGEDQAVAIHEARKCLKRVRALLRLVRPALDSEHYRRENARFRDIGRILSASRDRQVMRETVAHLADAADPPQQEALRALAELLSRDLSDGPLPAGSTQAVATAIAALDGARREFKKHRSEMKSGDPVRDGLKRNYRDGQKALSKAMADPNGETLHEWRKTVQTHWRHMLLLSEAWPEYFALRASAAKELSDVLGEDHDLAVLMDFVSSGEGRAIGPAHAEAIISLASVRQRQLRSRAFASGAFLFAENARALSKRVSQYWLAARRRSETEPADGCENAPGDETPALDVPSRRAGRGTTRGLAKRSRSA